MKISRYIYVPFYTGASFAIFNYLILRDGLDEAVWRFISFALFGFGFLLYSDYKVRKLTSKDNKEAFEVRQKRNIILFANYAEAFDLCLESVSILEGAKIKHTNELQGVIKVRTKMNWRTFGNRITYKLNKLTENTTEIEISTEPIPKTALVDYGEGFGLVEQINNFLDVENKRINRKYVEAKQFVPADFGSNYRNNKVRVD